MSNWLHYHPDSRVYIRRPDDTTLYDALATDFALDYGSPFPLPQGFAQLELFEGVVYGYDAKHNELDLRGSIDPTPYLAILASLDKLLAAKTKRELPPAETLAQAQARVYALLDRRAGEVRMKYITAAIGQEATYFIKERQADAFKTAGYPVLSIPGMIQAEMVATGQTAQQACDAILAQRDAWVAKAVQIEQARRVGKVKAGAAVDVAAVNAAVGPSLSVLDTL